MNIGAAKNVELTAFLTDKLGCLTQAAAERFDYKESAKRICTQFGTASPDELGIGSTPDAVCAVGGLLSYMIDTQKTDLSHINKLEIHTGGQFMELDLQTFRSLELTASMRTAEKKGSLLWVLDKTKTPMGRRLIRSWLSHPLLQPAAIKRRLSAVNELYSETVARSEMMLTLRDIGDMERLIGKIVYGSANCRDLKSLASSIEQLPRLTELLKTMKSAALSELAKADVLTDIMTRIKSTIVDEPPFSVREGDMIRAGVNLEGRLSSWAPYRQYGGHGGHRDQGAGTHREKAQGWLQ